MKLFRVFYKEEPLKIVVEAEDEKEALKLYKQQVVYKPGVSKALYSVKEYVMT